MKVLCKLQTMNNQSGKYKNHRYVVWIQLKLWQRVMKGKLIGVKLHRLHMFGLKPTAVVEDKTLVEGR